MTLAKTGDRDIRLPRFLIGPVFLPLSAPIQKPGRKGGAGSMIGRCYARVSQSMKLDQIADSLNTKLIITSFNGEYMGYITNDKHYLVSSHEEVRALNWVGPYYGEYYAQIIVRLLNLTAEK